MFNVVKYVSDRIRLSQFFYMTLLVTKSLRCSSGSVLHKQVKVNRRLGCEEGQDANKIELVCEKYRIV